jgi:hypothetical protein
MIRVVLTSEAITNFTGPSRISLKTAHIPYNDTRRCYWCSPHRYLCRTSLVAARILSSGQRPWSTPKIHTHWSNHFRLHTDSRLTIVATGNITQYRDPDGWEFQKQLGENYGQVVKMHGFLGVRCMFPHIGILIP